MRGWIVAVALLAACKSKGGNAPKVTLSPPTVKVATVVAKQTPAPPALLLVDPTSGVRLAAAATWADLDAMKLTVATHPGELGALDSYIHESAELGRAPLDALKRWEADYNKPVVLDDVRGVRTIETDDVDDTTDDSGDESGGTGTAMALDEGKMGKKDDVDSGQYRMKKYEDPTTQWTARPRPSREVFASTLTIQKPVPNRGPSRQAGVESVVRADGVFPKLHVLLLIAGAANASVLFEALGQTGGAIAVSYDGKIRPLNLDFTIRDSWIEYTYDWAEVRVSPTSLEVEAVPDAPIEVATLEDLAAALKTARDVRGMDDDSTVDVLVTPDVDVQRTLDVAVALELAGVHRIGLGQMPSDEEMRRRGHRSPTLSIGQPNAQGDLDKATIRKYVKRNIESIKFCYTTALIGNPILSGTVQTQFFISPDGIVLAASASGVDPHVSMCIADVIKGIVFPKPKGGGGVQVNYPFTFRP